MDTKQEQQISFVNALKAIDEMKEEEIGGFAVEYNYINEIVINPDFIKNNDLL